jgi:prolyl 4-hydroxylase
MIAYLNAGFGGGQTLFVASGLRVTGKVGDVLMFRNADEDGRTDPASQHAGLTVSSGEKLVASRLIRQRRFGPI